MIKPFPIPIAPKGLATSFPETSTPSNFASKFRNRFINGAGGAEKRRGIAQYNATVPGTPELTNAHERVNKDGSVYLYVSGQGKVWREVNTSTWSEACSFADPTAKIRSEDNDKYTIFYNGVDRPQYTEDGLAFAELTPVVHAGNLAAGSGQTKVEDADVSSWLRDTDVGEKDVIFNRKKNAYAIITVLSTTSLVHTQISTSAAGIGVATSAPETDDAFEVLGTTNLNIVPTDAAEDDNVATATSGTNTSVIAVSGLNFGATEVEPGDFVYNVTKVALTRVVSAGQELRVVDVSGMSSGDVLEFYKSAWPIPNYVRTHFGRTYAVDSRDQKKIRISGPNNPKDMVVDTGDIDTASIRFNGAVGSIHTFQRFLALVGRNSTFVYSGEDPIADTTVKAVNFTPVGSFPLGALSPDGAVNIGDDLVLVTNNGPQAISLGNDSTSLGRTNISEPIAKTLRTLLQSVSPRQIIAFHYTRRSWLGVKIGSELYIYNYATYFAAPNKYEGGFAPAKPLGSWSLFDGKFARMNGYLERTNGDLLCVGDGGKVYLFDSAGVYDDDGELYRTEYASAWLFGQKSTKKKAGKYITPIIETGGAIEYSVRAEAGYDAVSREEITVEVSGGNSQPIGTAIVGENVIGGAAAKAQKYALRWRGEAVRITFATEDDQGPDVIGTFFLHMVV